MNTIINKSFLKKILFLSLVPAFLFIFLNTQARANPLSERLKGKILLQVEQNGEAWYLNPVDKKKYFMGRPNDAFGLMKRLGIGITNNDLLKLEIADENLGGQDLDGDGLSDLVEDAIGTNKDNIDTDGDTHNDKDELIASYNPNGPGKISKDNGFAKKQAGKILLQVEKNGEAWYVNPDNNKIYYLGRPIDAFNIMRKLGLGITNSDLASIDKDGSGSPEEWSGEITCLLLADNLASCSPYKCQFKHQGTGKLLDREIFGFNKEGECLYLEELIGSTKVICQYQEQQRAEMVRYYKEKDKKNFSFSREHESINEGDNTVRSSSPLDNAIDNGQCSVGFIPPDVNISSMIKKSM